MRTGVIKGHSRDGGSHTLTSQYGVNLDMCHEDGVAVEDVVQPREMSICEHFKSILRSVVDNVNVSRINGFQVSSDEAIVIHAGRVGHASRERS